MTIHTEQTPTDSISKLEQEDNIPKQFQDFMDFRDHLAQFSYFKEEKRKHKEENIRNQDLRKSSRSMGI